MDAIQYTRRRKLSAKTMEVADLLVRVRGQSGAIAVTRNNMGKNKTAAAVFIKFDSLREVDSAGNIVGKKGKDKHSINSFARQDFEFGVDQIDVPIVIEDLSRSTNSTNITTTTNSTNSTNTTATDVASGAKITFDTSLDTGSKLAVELVLFSGAGEVGTATEKWSVQPGDMKFNFNMSEWVWCDPCNDGTGAFIDLDIEIKGSDDSPKENGSNKTYTLGGGVTLDLSDQILLDSAWTSMPEGYPKIESKGAKILYTFRIPKFDVDAMYDPIVSFETNSDADSAPTDTNDPNTSTVASVGRKMMVTGSILLSVILSCMFV